jgi:hypothetical protein
MKHEVLLVAGFFAAFAALLCELRGQRLLFQRNSKTLTAKIAKKGREGREEIQIEAQPDCNRA